MKKTFVCDSSMIITIPLGSLRDIRDGHLMPEKFHCVFRDSYKLFVLRGKPKALGAAQATVGMLLFALGLVTRDGFILGYTAPSILFVICGMLSFGAGKRPNMHVTKVSFFLNIISFFWSVVAATLCGLNIYPRYGRSQLYHGIQGLVLSLLIVEGLIALFLMYWLCKAVCREHFNTLPTILMKQGD